MWNPITAAGRSVKRFYYEQMRGTPLWIKEWEKGEPAREAALNAEIAAMQERERKGDEWALQRFLAQEAAAKVEAARQEARRQRDSDNLQRIAETLETGVSFDVDLQLGWDAESRDRPATRKDVEELMLLYSNGR